MNVEHEVCDCTGNNWSHQDSNEGFKEQFGSHTRKTFRRFTTLGTSQIIRKVLQCETGRLSSGYHGWFRSTREKRPVTRDGIMVVVVVVMTTTTTTMMMMMM